MIASDICWNIIRTRQVSSMSHSSRPTDSPVANIVFTLFCFARFWKVGTDGRKNGQHVQKQWSLPATVGWPSGSTFCSRLVDNNYLSGRSTETPKNSPNKECGIISGLGISSLWKSWEIIYRKIKKKIWTLSYLGWWSDIVTNFWNRNKTPVILYLHFCNE